MKNILSYIGILVLLGLVLFPPILRIVLPEKTKEEKKIDRNSYILSCSNQKFTINTSYEEEKIKMIVIKNKFTQEEIDKRKNLDENIENLDEQLLDDDTALLKYKEIVDLFDEIKNKTTVTYNVMSDGEIVSIDYSVDEHKELEIDKLTQSMNRQQMYYEKLDFSCSIK